MFQVLHDRQELNDLVVAVLKAFPDVSSHAKTAEMLFNIDFDVSVIVDDDQRYLEAKVSFSEVFEHAVKGVDVQDWLEYFNEILPPSRQLNSSSDLVLTTGLDQIRKSLSVITSYGVQKAGLYLSAYLAMHAAWMESVRLKVKHDDLRTALFCMNVTRHVLRQSWPQLTAKLIPVPREAAAVVEAVFESVKKASAGVGSFTWTGHKGRLAIVEAIGNTSLATRLPFEEGVDYSRLYSDEANATANGKPLADDDPEWAMKHFVATYFRAMRHDRQVLFSHPPSRLQTLLWRLGHTGKLRYVPAVRTVIVPGIYQMEPYAYISSSVDEYMPEYINYGTLGALLSWELARIVTRGRGASRVGPVALESREDFARGRQRRKGTDDSYLDRLYCLLDLHSSLGAEINLLRTKSAAGPDRVSNKMLRNLDDSSIANLATYMQECWEKGTIPQEWKVADLIFIPKPGKKLGFEILRPISLTSCVGKLMEQVVQTRLNRYMEENGLYPDTMIGFRPKLSACDVMLQLKDEIIHKQTRDTKVIVGLDVANAFDNLRHVSILENLNSLNVGEKVYHSIKDFLTNRKATLKIGEESIENIELGNVGTPQGSVLSPTLFNIAMLRLPEQLGEIENLNHTIYADDLTLWMNKGSDGQIESSLQLAIDIIEEYLKPKGLRCSAENFKHNVSGTPDEQHSEIFRRAQGVRLAYNALLANFRAASPDYDVFSTHWPDAQWAFFVRVCMVHCTADQTPRPLTPRERCLLPLHNMDEFAGAFECRTKPGFIRGSCLM
ncbi:uncharacterized protein LOC125945086 [Dermacentor silvarum]|uniref:uncharacterized protein LOC125945086 n=1 Tax=Dermacentor silvarum TaxID=543639 RepID=UPI002100FDB0|nr:uncharacterized protein LOC125945086 [Dermacentor silvarum]